MQIDIQFFIVNSRGTYVDWSMRALPAARVPDPVVAFATEHHVCLLGEVEDYTLELSPDTGIGTLRPSQPWHAGITLPPLNGDAAIRRIHFAGCQIDCADLFRLGGQELRFSPEARAALRPGGTLPSPLGRAVPEWPTRTPGSKPSSAGKTLHHLHLGGRLADYAQRVDASRGMHTLERISGLPRGYIEVVKFRLDGARACLHFADGSIALAPGDAANDKLGGRRFTVADFMPPGSEWRAGRRLADTLPSAWPARPTTWAGEERRQPPRMGSYPLIAPQFGHRPPAPLR